jgi:hypothetical protein
MCCEYPGLDPIRMLDYTLADVLNLMRHHMERNRRLQPKTAAEPGTVQRPRSDQEVIYRQADDSWL